jgi:short-subunit dehydrogenase
MLGLNRNLREELKPHGIRVTGVFPGATATDGLAAGGLSGDAEEDRLMKPEQVAELVVAIVGLGKGAVVEEVVMRPQLGDL